MEMCFTVTANIDLGAASKRKKDEKRDADLERRIVHVKYLMEKYGNRWLGKHRASRSFAVL